MKNYLVFFSVLLSFGVFAAESYPELMDQAEKLMNRYGISREEAARLREKTDASRAAYHKHYTGTEWLDVRNYDLSLDTSKLSQDECIRIVSAYIKNR